jgi:hypothetical protein
VQPLHDDDKRASLWVVEARLHGLIPPVQHTLPDGAAVGFYRIVGVINADNVSPVPGQSAANTSRNSVACVIIFKPLLLVLIVGQLELVTEVRLVPRAVDQPSTLGAIPDRQRGCIGRIEELLVGLCGPSPRRQRHGHAD